MLLLIPKEILELPKIPIADADDTLDNLFDIRLGLIEDRYFHLTEDSKQPVYFITAKSFTNIPNKKKVSRPSYNELHQLKTLDPTWIASIKSGILQIDNEKKDKGEPGKRSMQKRYIKENRILKQHDFLISIRGEPIGYSLLNMQRLLEYNMVPSHYFVRLSPRYPNKFNLEYLHLIMDQFTKHILGEVFEDLEKSTKQQGKSYAAFNSFSVEELKYQKIKYHSSIEEQNKLTDLYKEQFSKWQLQNLIFDEFEMKIVKTIQE